jgi:hypothetical protein
VVLDRVGDPVASGVGGVLVVFGPTSTASAEVLVERCTRRRGPITVLPTTWLVQANRATQVPPADLPAAVAATDLELGDAVAVVLLG